MTDLKKKLRIGTGKIQSKIKWKMENGNVCDLLTYRKVILYYQMQFFFNSKSLSKKAKIFRT